MKSKFLFPLAFLALAAIVSAFTYQADPLPSLPKYNPKMQKSANTFKLIPSVRCSASSWFGTCSADCGDKPCSCTSGIFRCSCSCGGKDISERQAFNLPSVSRKQYNNWIKFSNFLLKELGTDNAKAVHVALVEMANSLINRDENGYHKQAILAEELLGKMSKSEKEQINNFFAKEKADIKI